MFPVPEADASDNPVNRLLGRMVSATEPLG